MGREACTNFLVLHSISRCPMPLQSLQLTYGMIQRSNTSGKPQPLRGRNGQSSIENNCCRWKVGACNSYLVTILILVTCTMLTPSEAFTESRGVVRLTVYSAALRVVGIATCVRTGPPRSSLRKCKISLEASIGEPPPTEMIASALRYFKTCTPFLMSAIGLCCPISEKVPT